MLHTGDINHLSKPGEFDTVEQMLKECRSRTVFYVPGEHDVLDEGKQFRDALAKAFPGRGLVQL